jgi:O-antigen/teichoic acid export membrane protein
VASGRLRRLVGGLGVGYVHTAGTVLVGLWLTPYLIGQLGSHDYGLWLLGAQVVFWLGLLDLGVVALVPREVGAASGLSGATRDAALRSYLGRTARLAMWQMPLVAVSAALVLWLLPGDWAALQGPLLVVALVFLVLFPCRVFLATLEGLQDLTMVGTIQFAAWVAGAATVVAGASLGLGLYAFTGGWAVTQVLSVAVSWWRLRRAFPEVLPRRLPSLTRDAARDSLARSTWISVAQGAQVLLSGMDLLVIGRFLGPESVVVYACTGKLVTLLANQPQLLMQMALPGLSQLRVSGSRERLFEVSRSMTQVMLLGTGAIAAVVLTVNEPFVGWWVGRDQFGGGGLTALLLVGMLVRHLNVTAVYSLFCFGHERRLALTSLAEGVVGAVAMAILLVPFGLKGVAIGGIAATCLVGLPSHLRALSRESGTSPLALLSTVAPWASRLVVLVSVLAAAGIVWRPRSVVEAAGAGLAVGLVYLLVMIPVIRTSVLGGWLGARVHGWLAGAPGLVRRLVREPVPGR